MPLPLPLPFPWPWPFLWPCCAAEAEAEALAEALSWDGLGLSELAFELLEDAWLAGCEAGDVAALGEVVAAREPVTADAAGERVGDGEPA